MKMKMERRYELDNLRSLAMLAPGAQALRREDAIDLVAELEDLEPMLADRGLPSGDLGYWAVETR